MSPQKNVSPPSPRALHPHPPPAPGDDGMHNPPGTRGERAETHNTIPLTLSLFLCVLDNLVHVQFIKAHTKKIGCIKFYFFTMSIGSILSCYDFTLYHVSLQYLFK